MNFIGGIFGGGKKSVDIGVNLPNNYTGTTHFGGGWTNIHEQGGEIAFLPSGSTIVPADQTERLLRPIHSIRQDDDESEPHPQLMPQIIEYHSGTFAPKTEITVQGNADEGALAKLTSDFEAKIKELYEQFRSDELEKLKLQFGYT